MQPGRPFFEHRGAADRARSGLGANPVPGEEEDAGTRVMSGSVGELRFRVVKRRDRRYRALRTDTFLFEVTFWLDPVRTRRRGRAPPSLLLIDSLEAVTQALYRLLDRLRAQYRGQEYADVQFTVLSRHFESALNIRPHPLHGAGRDGSDAVSAIMYALEELIQSEPDIPLDNSFEVTAVVTNLPPVQLGGGGGGHGGGEEEEEEEEREPPAKRRRRRKVRGKEGVLGEAFREPSMTAVNRFLRFPPNYSGVLRNCCFLTSLRLGLAHNEEMLSIKGGKVPKDANTRDWRILRFLNLRKDERRAKRARRHLEKLTLEMCDNYGLNPEVLRLSDLESVRSTVDKIGLNVDVYSNEAGYNCVFSHPHRHDPSLQTVSLFLARHSGTNILHCGILTRPDKFLSGKRLRNCNFCNRSFYIYYFNYHKCKGRHNCKFCNRILARNSDYLDFVVAKRFCLSAKTHPDGMRETVCRSCGTKMFTSQDCRKEHDRMCKKLEKCKKCDRAYQKTKRKHRCGDVFCRTCKRYYNLGEGEHHCAMTRPFEQKEWSKLAIFDFETRTDESDRHIVNAVGVSYETEFGKFREVNFYDDEMEHELDGVDTGGFEFKYWPDRIEEPPEISRPKHIRSLKECVLEGGGQEEEEEEEEEDGLGGGMMFSDEAREVAGDEGDEDEDDFSGDDDGRLGPDWSLGKDVEEDIVPGSALHKFVTKFVTPEFFGYCFIAHNFSRFDGLLLLNYLVKKMRLLVTPLFEGQKLLHLKVAQLKITFVDSYRYIKMPLSKFVERFPDLKSEIGSKGTFPYRFNRPEHYGYDGEVPDEGWFLDRFSTPAEVESVRKFRSLKMSEPGATYNFNRELDTYLRQDVRVLRGGCLHQLKENFQFQEELPREAKIPFHCFSKPFFTGSSFAHGIFRYFSLKERELYLLDNQTGGRKTSKMELEWLEYESFKRNIYIRHAFNHKGGQKKVGNYFLDGYHVKSNTAYEFLGCVVHGHVVEDKNCALSKGMTAASRNPYGRAMEDVWTDWNRKLRTLIDEGLEVKAMWECYYSAEREANEDLKNFLREEYYRDGLRPIERLILRNALRGGRTEAFRLLYRRLCERGEKWTMHYVDKNSLYPDVAINKEYPTGIPTVYIGRKLEEIGFRVEKGFYRKSDGGRVLGVVQASMLPPDSQFLPALPTIVNGKLKFGLCNLCLLTEQKTWCRHSDEQRTILDTWTTIEVEHAVRCGYRLVKVHEMVLYDTSAPVFRDHYMGLARMKLESEGFPSESMTGEEKKEYVARMNEEMPGLNLQVGRVEKNRPRRQFAKDMSNIGLGKMSQSDMRQSSEYVNSWYRLSELKYSPHVTLTRVIPITETCAEAVFIPKEDKLGFAKNTQSVVYAFVTAYARIGMLDDMRTLQKLGARIFYMDTDSIIMCFPADGDFQTLEKKFRFGSSAYGAYKYETSSPIESFVACGPKNYSYRTVDGEEVVKVRGFTLRNKQALDALNNDTMTELLQSWLEGRSEEVRTLNFSMKLNRAELSVKNSALAKRYRNDNFDKRYVPRIDVSRDDPFVTTYPFGCKHAEFDDL